MQGVRNAVKLTWISGNGWEQTECGIWNAETEGFSWLVLGCPWNNFSVYQDKVKKVVSLTDMLKWNELKWEIIQPTFLYYWEIFYWKIET
jgi:hypothetical protein